MIHTIVTNINEHTIEILIDICTHRPSLLLIEWLESGFPPRLSAMGGVGWGEVLLTDSFRGSKSRPLDVSIPCRGLGARPTLSLSFMESGGRETALECVVDEVKRSCCKLPAPGPQSERVPPVTAKASNGVAKGTARSACITWTPSREASLLRISEAYKGEDLLLSASVKPR